MLMFKQIGLILWEMGYKDRTELLVSIVYLLTILVQVKSNRGEHIVSSIVLQISIAGIAKEVGKN